MERPKIITRDYGYAWQASHHSGGDGGPPARPAPSPAITDTARSADEPPDWTRRHLDLGAEAALLADAIAGAIDAGDRCAPLLAVRRLFGGIHGVRDALFDLSSAASNSGDALSAYGDCAHWWIAQLVRNLRSAVASGEADRARAIREAATFASFYALAQLAPLVPPGLEEDTPAGRLVGDVQWLTWQLKDLCED